MCGLAGIVLSSPPDDGARASLVEMAEIMRHRGPDDGGVEWIGSVGLASRRLSIIDLSANGHMPMKSADAPVWIVYNGEVYNFADLREDLVDKGYRFVSGTDTEVVLQAYREYGLAFASKLNGMFAIAIWDEESRRLVLVRDRLGIKPLYYYWDSKTFMFASELSAMTRAGSRWMDRSISAHAMNQFMIYGHFPAPMTPFRYAKKMMPGSIIIFNDDDVQEQRYWRFPIADSTPRTEVDWLEELEELLAASVKRRLISDVPVGGFLSGGVDSTCVSSLAARHAGGDFQTFSIGYSDDAFDESRYAKAVAIHIGTKHQSIKLDQTDLSDDIPRIMGAFDEPFYDHSAIPTYYVSKMAREQVTVCLSGDGGDELFFGYRHLFGNAETMAANEEAHAERAGLPGKLMHGLPDRAVRYLYYASVLSLGRESIVTERLTREHKHRRVGDWPEFFVRHQGRVPFESRRRLLKDQEGLDAEADYLRSLIVDYSSRSHGEQVAAVDLQNYLQNDILVKVDRMSMLNSLEVRVPLLDHTVVEFAGRLPFEMKVHNGTGKFLLKRLIERLIGDAELSATINRPKQGFRFPMARYVRGTLESQIRDSVGTRKFLDDVGLTADSVASEIDQFYRQKQGGKAIWMLYCLYLWWERNLRATGEQNEKGLLTVSSSVG